MTGGEPGTWKGGGLLGSGGSHLRTLSWEVSIRRWGQSICMFVCMCCFVLVRMIMMHVIGIYSGVSCSVALICYHIVIRDVLSCGLIHTTTTSTIILLLLLYSCWYYTRVTIIHLLLLYSYYYNIWGMACAMVSLFALSLFARSRVGNEHLQQDHLAPIGHAWNTDIVFPRTGRLRRSSPAPPARVSLGGCMYIVVYILLMP